MLLESLQAPVATCRYVIVVGLDVHDVVAIDRDLEATEGFADPAKRVYGLGHGRPSL
jgi:hypothetical protein